MWNLRISKEIDVNVVGDGDEPESVSKEGGYEPVLADEDVVEKQLHKMKNHQQWEKGTGTKQTELL
jgi:hypothetical protein